MLGTFRHNSAFFVNRLHLRKRIIFIKFGYAGMNFVAVKIFAAEICKNALYAAETAFHADSAFLFGKNSFNIQKADTGGIAAFFHAIRVAQVFAEHLVTAANAENNSPFMRVLQNFRFKTTLTQPFQVANSIFGAGNDNHIGIFQILHFIYITQGNAGNKFKHVKIGVVGHARNTHNSNINRFNFGMFG